MRGTTRDPARAPQIEAAGIEPFVADPDRVATLVPAFAHVAVTCVLLGSASGSAQSLAALHSTRLAMLLEKLVDTTSRGVVYESVGSVDGALLDAGAELLARDCARWGLPFALLQTAPEPHDAWLQAAGAAVDGVLLGG